MKRIRKALRSLKTRFDRRLYLQKKHYRKWQKFKDRGRPGDKRRAQYHRKRFEVNRKAVEKLVGLTKERRRELNALVEKLKSRIASGTGPYAGTESVAREIERVVEEIRGECSGSEKRWETYGNPGSDHHESQKNAYAIDFYLANDYEMAYIIAKHFGVDWAGDYSNFYITRGGRTFRIQIIAGTHGTGPHLHVGVRRA